MFTALHARLHFEPQKLLVLSFVLNADPDPVLPSNADLDLDAASNNQVLRIHDILIRILGYIPMISGSGSCYFRQWSSGCQKCGSISLTNGSGCGCGSGSTTLAKKMKIHADSYTPPWVQQVPYLPECPAPVARVASRVLDEWVGRGPGLTAVRRQVHPDYPPSAARPRVTFTHIRGVVFRKLIKKILHGPVLRSRNYFFRLRLRLQRAANPNCGCGSGSSPGSNKFCKIRYLDNWPWKHGG